MKIELPQVGESVTEGIIGRWLVKVGDRVEKYDLLVEVVTDKVNMEMPSPVSGVLTGILAQEGETVPMGGIIADIQVDGEDEGAAAAETPTVVPAPETSAIDTTGVLLKGDAPGGPTGAGVPVVEARREVAAGPSRQRHSPAVQRLAQEHGVDLARVAGTGMGGRVTRKDVQLYIESAGGLAAGPPPATADDEERVPLIPVRRMIADNMVKSSTQIPQAWSIVEVDVTGLVQCRESLKDGFQQREGINLTYLPFVLSVLAESLKEHPLLNSTWDADAIILKRRINIGIAAAAPGGLVVPVIHDADSLSITGLAGAVHDLTTRAREGKLTLSDVQGGTFTLNNTGPLGSFMSRPLVNYPQAAILATESIVKRPVVVNDAISIRSMMNVCLTFDHRIMDGAEAGAFTRTVKQRLGAIGPDTPID